MLPPRHSTFLLQGLALCFSTALVHCRQYREDSSCQQSPTPISRVINHLSNALVAEIGGTENFFFSPLSVSVALGMVYLGARGTSAEQMREALVYDLLEEENTPDSSDSVHLQFKSLLTALNQNAGQDYNLLTANGMFPGVAFELLPVFLQKLEEYYSAQSVPLDYFRDGTAAVQVLNDWVSNRTNGKIEEIFDSTLDPLTVLVLLNIVYFKGLWKIPFDERLTYDRLFHNYDGSTTRTSFMSFTGRVNYYHDSEMEYSFLELKYKGDSVSMLVALPDSRSEFPGIELNSELLCRVKSRMRRTRTEVHMPKFKLQYEKELSEIMARLGMDELFGQEKVADLSGMRFQNDTELSLFVHKCVIDVNEQGSEAAAASAVAFSARSGNFNRDFMANHPFLFSIIEKTTGAILFTGRVTKL